MSQRKAIILGAGGHARVVCETLQRCGQSILGFIEKDNARQGEKQLGVSILGDEAYLEKMATQDVDLFNGLGSIGDVSARTRCFEYWKAKGYQFGELIHPSAHIAQGVSWGEGVQVMAGVCIQTGTKLGDNVVVNTSAVVDHDCQLGDHGFISPGAILSGGVELAKKVHVGTGSVVVQYLRIGEGTSVAAGAVVTKEIAENQLVKGVPGRASPKKNH